MTDEVTPPPVEEDPTPEEGPTPEYEKTKRFYASFDVPAGVTAEGSSSTGYMVTLPPKGILPTEHARALALFLLTGEGGAEID